MKQRHDLQRLSQANVDVCIMCSLMAWLELSKGRVRACESSAAVRPGLASGRFAICGHGSAACSQTRAAAMVEPDAFAQLLSYVEKETETLKLLRCKTLKECLLSGKASSKRDGDPERFKHYKIYLALQQKMSAEQRDMIEEWERDSFWRLGKRHDRSYR